MEKPILLLDDSNMTLLERISITLIGVVNKGKR